MTREEIISKIIEMFKVKYNIDLSEYSEDTDVTVLSQVNDKLDSIEFMNFIFDVEDELGLKDVGSGTMPTKLKELFDLFEDAVNKKG